MTFGLGTGNKRKPELVIKAFFDQQQTATILLNMVDLPAYSQKIWDDDADNDGSSDSLFGAPTIRSLTDIAVTVAVTAMAPGARNIVATALMSTAANMADDALFTALDVQNGQMDGDAAWSSLGKMGATSFVSSLTGSAMSGLDTNVFDFGNSFLEVATDVGIAGTTTAINTYGGAAINSWEGGFDFDNDTFNSMTSWENTKVSYISSMAGAGVSSTLDTGTFGYINDVKANADTLTGLAGGLTSSAIQYGMTGDTTLNLASIYGTGFMEMHLGGDGPMFNFGMSGTDVSLGTLSSAYQGLDAFKQNRIIRKSGVDDRLTAGMRTLYSAKMDETTDL